MRNERTARFERLAAYQKVKWLILFAVYYQQHTLNSSHSLESSCLTSWLHRMPWDEPVSRGDALDWNGRKRGALCSAQLSARIADPGLTHESCSNGVQNRRTALLPLPGWHTGGLPVHINELLARGPLERGQEIGQNAPH